MDNQDFEKIKTAYQNLAGKQAVFTATEEAINKLDRLIGDGVSMVSLDTFTLEIPPQTLKTFLEDYSSGVDNETKELAKDIKII